MKRLAALLTLSCTFFPHDAFANAYKIKEYNDEGKIRISFKHTPKLQKEEKKYELLTLSSDLIEDLIPIRRSPEVYEHYDDHQCPTEDEVRNELKDMLLPRVTQPSSLFPFVLREVVKENSTKLYNVLGFFNVGYGFNEEDRQYGYYIRASSQGKGIGIAAIKNMTHFVMQFHKKAGGVLTAQSKKKSTKLIPIQKTRFQGAISATCDPGNLKSSIPLTKAGLKEISEEDIEKRNLKKDVGEKKYFEMTWEEFYKNEANGLYKDKK